MLQEVLASMLDELVMHAGFAAAVRDLPGSLAV